MRKTSLSIALAGCCGLSAAFATVPDLEALMDQAAFRDTIRRQNDGALIDQSTALEQSQTYARSRSDYGIELRPSVSDNDVGIALRVYLPDRWSKKRLHEQLTLAAESEQLRVAALEWLDVIAVYRDFGTYRKLKDQMALTDGELRFMEPYLAKADQSVERNELAINDRARLYSTYLALLNDQHELTTSFLDTQRRLRMILGPNADLEKLSTMAVITMPSQLEIKSLLRTALEQRADYRQLGVDMRAMQLAEEAARTEDGFRMKYIQPGYSVDYNNGSSGWIISTAIVLPWGTKNPDIAVYQHEQALALAAQTQQKKIIEDRLRVTLDLANAYYAQAAEQNRRIKPVLDLLHNDLEQLAEVPLDQIRDVISIRERMLNASLQSAELKYRTEILAIDLAEELGGW